MIEKKREDLVMATVQVLKDVPESDVDQVISDFESEGCTVEKEKQPNGKYTVRATCPDE
jgi:hypothetical protein